MLNNSILRKVGSISRIIASVSEIKFKKYSLQKGQHVYLVRVCEHPGITLTELTRMVKVDKSTTTKAIQKLEALGYITKQHPADNRKSIVLYPTHTAESVYPKIIEEENLQLSICFRDFTETEKKMALHYLERMCTNIENYK